MKFRFTEIVRGATTLYLLNYTSFDVAEFDHYLLPEEKKRMHSFKHIKRKREFLATRILCRRIFGDGKITYSEFGAPHINKEEYISISHSVGIVAIAVNPSFKIGLDLEPHRKNILTVMHKFLSSNEKQEFDSYSTLEMTKVWSAKEALYKLAGRKKLIFSTELLLEKDAAGNWLGTIINPDYHLSVKLDIFELNDTIFSLNSESIVKVSLHN